MTKDEHKKRVAEAMRRFYEAQQAAGIYWPLIRRNCNWKRSTKIMCNGKQAELTLSRTTDTVI